ncbi:MAG: ABC transporter permease [Gaiellaceae bacterium]
MSARVTFATTLRVLTQLRRDPRTIALILLVPTLLVFLFEQIFSVRRPVFQGIGGPMLGLFPFIAMFLVTSITMLRERVSGTLERLMTLPLAKLDILFGYALAFALLAAAQTTIVSIVAFEFLGLDTAGPAWVVVLLAVTNATLGMALGLFVSAFAQTEFQAIQFMPAFVFPQMILCGIFTPRAQMAGWLRGVSDVLPLTYAYDALARVTQRDLFDTRFWVDLAVVLGAMLLALALGASTLRRRTG